MIRNNPIFGFFICVAATIFGVMLMYVLKYVPENVSLADFFFMLKTNRFNISKVISLGLLANIPLITYYKNRKQFETLKGIFVAIILFALIAISYKLNLL